MTNTIGDISEGKVDTAAVVVCGSLKGPWIRKLEKRSNVTAGQQIPARV